MNYIFGKNQNKPFFFLGGGGILELKKSLLYNKL